MLAVKSPIDNLVAFLGARRKQLGLTQREVAKGAGMLPGTYANLELGRVTRSPRADTLARLALGLRVDLDAMTRIAGGEDPEVAMQEAGRWGQVTLPSGRSVALRPLTGDEISLLSGAASTPIAYYGRVGCGDFLQLCEAANGERLVANKYLVDADVSKLGTVEAAGDSMNQAGILPGMTMLVRCQEHADPGDVVLVDVPFAGTTCKRLVVEAGRAWLRAESSSAHAQIEMVEGIRVVGVVLAAWMLTEFKP